MTELCWNQGYVMIVLNNALDSSIRFWKHVENHFKILFCPTAFIFVIFLKIYKNGVIHISLAFNSCITRENRQKMNKLSKNVRISCYTGICCDYLEKVPDSLHQVTKIMAVVKLCLYVLVHKAFPMEETQLTKRMFASLPICTKFKSKCQTKGWKDL